MSFYKKRYAIAFYSADEDELVGVFDNVQEIALKTKLKPEYLRTILCRCQKGTETSLVFGFRTKIFLIDMREEEKEVYEHKN